MDALQSASPFLPPQFVLQPPAATGVTVDKIGAGGAGTAPVAPKPKPPSPPKPLLQDAPVTAVTPGSGDDLAAMERETLGRVRSDEERKQKMPPAPPPELLAQPQPKNTSPIDQWGSYAMMFAALGSMFTRTPMTTALNAAAGVMNAFKQGDKDAYDAAYSQWKTAQDYAFKLYDFQSKQYDNSWKLLTSDQDEAMKELEITARAHHDAAMEQHAKNGEVLEALRLNDSRENTVMRMKELNQKFALGDEQRDIYMSLTSARRELGAAQQSKNPDAIKAAQEKLNSANERAVDFSAAYKGKPEAPELTPEAQAIAATNWRLTGQMPSLGLGGVAQRVGVMNAAGEQMKKLGIDPVDVASGQMDGKALKSALTKIETVGAMSNAQERAAIKALGLVEGLMNKGAGTSAGPIINRWFQAGRMATADPDVAAFNTAVHTFTNEYAKIMTGSTAATGSTDSARAEVVQDMFNKYGSVEQMTGQIGVMRQDMGFKVDSWSAQRAELLRQYRAIGGGETGGAKGGKTYNVGDIITINGKPYRATTAGTNPDVEVVKSAAPAPQEFVDGQIYKDANGNKALRQDGKWIPVP